VRIRSPGETVIEYFGRNFEKIFVMMNYYIYSAVLRSRKTSLMMDAKIGG